MEELDRLDERESDLRLLALAQVRALNDNGVRHSLDDVLAELGIVLDGAARLVVAKALKKLSDSPEQRGAPLPAQPLSERLSIPLSRPTTDSGQYGASDPSQLGLLLLRAF